MRANSLILLLNDSRQLDDSHVQKEVGGYCLLSGADINGVKLSLLTPFGINSLT